MGKEGARFLRSNFMMDALLYKRLELSLRIKLLREFAT